MAINPVKDWDWDKETQSRILMKLDELCCIMVNANRQKGSPKAKPGEQWQPKYVKEAKQQAKEQRETEKRLTAEQMAAIKSFWKHRNPEAKFMEK